MPSSQRFNSMLKQRRKENKDTQKLLNLLFKPLKQVGKSTSKAIKKSVKQTQSSKKSNIIICPICSSEITKKNFNGLRFNDDPICSNCQKIIELHFGDKNNRGNIYLNDLKNIVQSYNKQ